MNHKIAEEYGWTIECESPLEIRHEDGSFASGQAAEVMLAVMAIRNDADESEEITISNTEFEHLQRRDDLLSCLEAAGVDNWSGYDAMEEHRG